MPNVTLPMDFDPTAFVQNQKADAQKNAFIAWLGILACTGALFIMLGAWVLEWFLTFAVVEANFGAELPEDPVPIKVYILSFATIAAILAFHALMLGQPDHPIAIWLRRIARIMLVVFFAGMALLFLSTDLTASQVVLSDDDLFNRELSFGEQLWAAIQPFISMTSAAALGGLVFINLALTDVILSKVSAVLPAKLSERHDARAILTSAKSIEETKTRYSDAEREENVLNAKDEDELVLDAAGAIADAAQPTIQALRETALEAGLIPPAGSSMLDKTGKAKSMPDGDELKRFLGDWEGFTDELPDKLRSI